MAGVVGLLVLAGCGDPGRGAGPRSPAAGPVESLEDGLGRLVRVPVPARRIISLAPSNTEILHAVGAEELLVGRDDPSDWPPGIERVPAVGSTGGKLSLERIVSLEPDLVLAAEITSPDGLKPLEALGLTVFLVPNPISFDGLHANVELIGRIAGRSAEAERLVASLRSRIRAVEARVRADPRRPRVFYELDATDGGKPWTVGPGTFLDRLISMAGGENVGRTFDHPYPRTSVEELLRLDPEIIVLGDAGAGVTPESLRGRPGWGSLSAVRSGRIHAFDGSLGSRPGPRLVDGLEELRRIIGLEVPADR